MCVCEEATVDDEDGVDSWSDRLSGGDPLLLSSQEFHQNE
jgi:hypothetical protein